MIHTIDILFFILPFFLQYNYLYDIFITINIFIKITANKAFLNGNTYMYIHALPHPSGLTCMFK